MRVLIFIFLLFNYSFLLCQDECDFSPVELVVCKTFKDDVINSNNSKLIDHLEQLPSKVIESVERYLVEHNKGMLENKFYREAIYFFNKREDYAYLSNNYLIIFEFRPSSKITIKTGVVFDSLGLISHIYGMPDSGWGYYKNSFLVFCDANAIFLKKFPSTSETKYLELELFYRDEKRDYVWQLRKIKSAIVNEKGDRKGIDCKLFLNALTHSIVYESKKKVYIGHKNSM